MNWIVIAGLTGACLPTPTTRATWGSLKAIYR
jgi:hypothetical protein